MSLSRLVHTGIFISAGALMSGGLAFAGSEAVIMFDWARAVPKAAEPPGVQQVAFPYHVSFDSRHDGEWETFGEVTTWTLTIRVPGASSVAAEFTYLPTYGSLLSVAEESLIGGKARFVSRHTGTDTIAFKLTAPAGAAVPSVSVSRLMLAEPASEAKLDEPDDAWYACNRTAAKDLNGRATALILVEGSRMCTATLLSNDTGVARAARPLLMTAAHCVGRIGDELAYDGNDADDIRVYWNFDSTCDGSHAQLNPGNVPAGVTEQVGGRSVLFLGESATAEASYDNWLIELDSLPQPEADAYMAALDATTRAPQGTLYGIHHGDKRPKQYVESATHSYMPWGRDLGGGNRSTVSWTTITTTGPGTVGRTRPGASGSGLFSSSGAYLATASTGSDKETTYSNIDLAWANGGLGAELSSDPSSGRVIAGKEAPLPPAPPSVSVSADRSTASVGDSATVTWSATDAESCVASGAWAGDKPLSGNATVTLAASGTAAYSLTCSGLGGTVTRTVVITVGAAAGGGGGGANGVATLMLLLIAASRRLIRR